MNHIRLNPRSSVVQYACPLGVALPLPSLPLTSLTLSCLDGDVNWNELAVNMIVYMLCPFSALCFSLMVFMNSANVSLSLSSVVLYRLVSYFRPLLKPTISLSLSAFCSLRLSLPAVSSPLHHSCQDQR